MKDVNQKMRRKLTGKGSKRGKKERGRAEMN
jgi:hypothetical protein